MNSEILYEILDRAQTPLYIYDLDAVSETVSAFRQRLDGKADICFAMKANPFLVQELAPIADRIEVCSMGEYRICRALNIAREKLLISGVLKKRDDILEILSECGGTCRYTLESPAQFDILKAWSLDHKEDLYVYPRLTSGNQFGMDEETVISIIRDINKLPYMHLAGIHFFSGTQKRKFSKWNKEFAHLDSFFKEVEEKTGSVIGELEYGPGNPIAYFDDQQDTLMEGMEYLSSALDEMSWKGKVTFEMGRAFTAYNGSYLTSVCDVKCNKDKHICIVDGGIHQINYDGQIRGMYLPDIRVLPKNKASETLDDSSYTYTVYGSLCTTNDILVQTFETGCLNEGDVLVFEKTGAYSVMEGMSLFLSHELPGVYFYSKADGLKCVRDMQETYTLNMIKEEK